MCFQLMLYMFCLFTLWSAQINKVIVLMMLTYTVLEFFLFGYLQWLQQSLQATCVSLEGSFCHDITLLLLQR